MGFFRELFGNREIEKSLTKELDLRIQQIAERDAKIVELVNEISRKDEQIAELQRQIEELGGTLDNAIQSSEKHWSKLEKLRHVLNDGEEENQE